MPSNPNDVEPTKHTVSLPLVKTPSKRGKRLALLALAMGGFGIGTTEFASMGLLPYIADGFEVTIPQAGQGISTYALGVVVGAPLITGLAAKVERKLLLVVLLSVFVLGNLFTAIAPTQPLFLVARFFTGLPHGAYFGVAVVVAASLVKKSRRARAIARVMLGLAVANIVGVPLVTLLGHTAGWRGAYGLTGAIGVLALLAVVAWVPQTHRDLGASFKRELSALKRPQVLLAVAIGAIGFGGIFAVYTYVSPIFTDVAGVPLNTIPWVLAAYGFGMTAGTVLAGPIVDRTVMGSIIYGTLGLGVVLAVFAIVASNATAALVVLVLIGAVGALINTGLQVRLMNVSKGAPSLAASMNHSAFNLANANGAFLGGVIITAGYGLLAPAWVGVALAVIGVAIAVFALALERHATKATTTMA
ncbi:MFS transporter [Paeniglutamicibacter antarcticus]|uniref:MFS transporter n=1 Tax=Paeniglutamicibacter antarcticus TaxID=494023 RepID=A0ABP9TJ89_9MICC